jgi:hypothetical protein
MFPCMPDGQWQLMAPIARQLLTREGDAEWKRGAKGNAEERTPLSAQVGAGDQRAAAMPATTGAAGPATKPEVTDW